MWFNSRTEPYCNFGFNLLNRAKIIILLVTLQSKLMKIKLHIEYSEKAKNTEILNLSSFIIVIILKILNNIRKFYCNRFNWKKKKSVFMKTAIIQQHYLQHYYLFGQESEFSISLRLWITSNNVVQYFANAIFLMLQFNNTIIIIIFYLISF